MIGIENTQRVGVFVRVARKIVMAGLVLPFSALTKAEVTLDGTLGPAGSLAGPNFVIPDTMGQTVGTNLFHSFGLFNINTGESATFTGPSSIENVLGRVTGGSSSFIDGLLRTQFENASPNLFLLNPAGVLFGPNASLDVQGSFHVSTADYLKLGDGGRFEATKPENSVLTVAPPEAFGFLGEKPAGIAVQGSLLQVPDGETLSVVGGDIQIADGSLYAPGGRIDMVSVASPGEVLPNAPDLGVASFARLGRIEVSHASSERPVIDGNEVGNVDASGEGGGRIFIRSGEFVADNAFIFANTRGSEEGQGIDIGVTGQVTMRNGALITAEANPGSSGDAGDLTVNVDYLTMREGAEISVSTFGAGRGGDLRVTADTMLLEGVGEGEATGLFAGTERGSTGDAGELTVNVDRLTMRDGAAIGVSTFGEGRGGDLRVTADTMFLEGVRERHPTGLFAGAGGESTGDAGDLTVNVDHLTMRDGAAIGVSTFGKGRGGNLRVTADTMLLEGVREEGHFTGLFASARPGSTGDAGDLTVNVDHLTMRDGAEISVSTFGKGRGGHLRVTADTMFLEGVHGGDSTGLFAQALSEGDAGELTVNVDRLTMRDGAAIRTSTFGAGRGGDLRVTADTILLEGVREGHHTGLFASARPGSTGDAGDITVKVDRLQLREGAAISVETAQSNAGKITLDVGSLLHLRDQGSITTSVAGGEGKGGNIILNSVLVVLDEGSSIIANALEGQGGDILIRILGGGALFQSPDSLIQASSEFGIDGSVVIDAPDTDIIAGFAGLPANFLDAATVLTQLCAERSGASVSSLVVRKYEVLPDSPYALRVQLPRAMPAPRTVKQSRTPRTYYAGSPLPPMLSCLGNG